MACGTGKTFTSLRLAEQLVPEGGRILFLAPSISLVSQTLREWTAQAHDPIHAFVVCSDSKVGHDEEDLRTHDLAYPATTDSRKLANAAQALTHGRRVVVLPHLWAKPSVEPWPSNDRAASRARWQLALGNKNFRAGGARSCLAGAGASDRRSAILRPKLTNTTQMELSAAATQLPTWLAQLIGKLVHG